MSDIENSSQPVDIKHFVRVRVTKLQEAYLGGNPSAAANLARLRRGVANQPGADLELVDLTIAGLYPEEVHLGDAATDLEQAAYRAITLFAVHQQSHRSSRMHQDGYSFGRSARLLATQSNADEAVRRRFNALGTAQSWSEIGHQTRGLIQQFRAKSIPLDYAQFAVDLLLLRNPRRADSVRLAWGRDFYRTKFRKDELAADDVAESLITDAGH
jgi:CRISPR system Cascade subunit CasB